MGEDHFHSTLLNMLDEPYSEFPRILIGRISAQQPSILAAVEPNPLDEVLPKLPHLANDSTRTNMEQVSCYAVVLTRTTAKFVAGSAPG